MKETKTLHVYRPIKKPPPRERVENTKKTLPETSEQRQPGKGKEFRQIFDNVKRGKYDVPPKRKVPNIIKKKKKKAKYDDKYLDEDEDEEEDWDESFENSLID